MLTATHVNYAMKCVMELKFHTFITGWISITNCGLCSGMRWYGHKMDTFEIWSIQLVVNLLCCSQTLAVGSVKEQNKHSNLSVYFCSAQLHVKYLHETVLRGRYSVPAAWWNCKQWRLLGGSREGRVNASLSGNISVSMPPRKSNSLFDTSEHARWLRRIKPLL